MNRRLVAFMIQHSHAVEHDVVGMGDLHGDDALVGSNVAHDQIVVAFSGIGGAGGVFATGGVDVFDDHIAIALQRLLVVLHVDGVDARFGVDLPDGDIVGAVANFHRS